MKIPIVKTYCLFFVLAVCYLFSDKAIGADFTKIESQKAVLGLISDRVRDGDVQALRDAATLDLSIAAPYLGRYMLNFVGSPAAANLATEELRKVPGHGEALRQYILDHANGGIVKINTFKVLAMLKTKEAVCALAYFLINDTTPAADGGDYFIPSGKNMAAQALGDMHLATAPTNLRPADYEDKEVAAWQNWWLAHQSDYQP